MQPEEILHHYWGYPSFRPGQKAIVKAAADGRDVVALLPTGGGKSICYQVPSLMQDGVCIVVTPLIALMKDQVHQLKQRNISCYAIYSGLSQREIDIILDNCVYGKVKFLYVSPERLHTTLFQERFKKMTVNLIAVDEAHCISQWGYDFRPAYLDIAILREMKPDVPFIALTASATPEVEEDIITKLELRTPEIFRKSFVRNNLSYSVFWLEDKYRKLIEILKKVPGTSIVYVSSRKKTLQIAEMLRKHGISAGLYHAGLAHNERATLQDKWINGSLRVMVATNAFGMGIDKADVRTVIHIDIPPSLEAYYQEAGRAGRDGKKAFGVLLVNHQDRVEKEALLEKTYPSLEFIQRVYQALCNHYNLAVGSYVKDSLPFDLQTFVKAFQLAPVETFYALKMLEKEGILQLNDGFYQPSRIMMLVEASELYQFQVANQKLDPVIKAMMRLYGGDVFTNYQVISERKLGQYLQKSPAEVKKLLMSLKKMQVADYVPSSDKPRLTFLKPRLKTNDLPVNHEGINVLYERDQRKLKEMFRYASLNQDCRAVFIAGYFGENDAERCGICDNCLSRHQQTKEKGEVKDRVLSALNKQKMLPESLINTLNSDKKEAVEHAVRTLLDEGKIMYNQEGLLVCVES